MQEFLDDDRAYLGWIAAHPDGFVVNARRARSPTYFVLHRARCRSISSERPDGAYTARGYRKLCADSVTALDAAARAEGREHGGFSKVCGTCAPL